MIRKIKKWIQCYRLGVPFSTTEEQLTLLRIRAHLLFFGHDTADLSDEQIIQGLTRVGEIISKCGVTTEEATARLSSVCNVN